jgi:dienelactone hydrolase
VFGAVGQVAFGKYLSPDFMVHPGEYIPPVPTRSGVPKAQATSGIYFNLYLPSGLEPIAGWPVVIFGHGSGLSKQGGAVPGTGSSLAVAASLAAHGYALLAIDAVGHGFGALSTMTVSQAGGSSVTFPAGGRGVDQNHDGQIGTSEGLEAASPRRLQLVRDGVLQTVADLVQLVRVIQIGVDVDDDGRSDLDPSRIYWLGQSLGGAYGIDLFAVEPAIRAAVFNVPFGIFAENRRIPAGSRPLLGAILATRMPSLLNPPGVISIDGVPVSGPNYFQENLPLRDGITMTVTLQNGAIEDIRSPATNTAAGALQLQTWADRAAWAGHASDPIAYASHLRHDPLAGMPVRPVLIGFAKGDRQVFNANTTNILRAGALADRATFFRNDLAFAENPTVPKDPHGFMTRIDIPAVADIARSVQQQIATFFDSDGTTIVHPEPSRFFEVPVSTPLPEGLAYIP